ncbi:hypothetical protein LZQ00_07755 [Sphingobacterium sp. SRCM116780]|uniref:hypothetical protein n=1 Tax=Sphingobacterium sp. SRCM116780 TaxID=2907623 RepID=UPI001F1B0C4A|nr:hypothetical protein [Sphingobacterium sp. SRCM116780]UIR57705.1 hypothetical protein LZQ00_07755 [Sphingobacterium sp. SRCM116780]
MLKNIIILSILYAAIILGVTLTINSMSNYYIPFILITSMSFLLMLIREIVKKYSSEFKPINNTTIRYQPFDNTDDKGKLKNISERPFFFGLEKKLLSPEDFYFDEDNFYAINTYGEKATFPLNDITELKGTAITITNRRIWQLKIASSNEEITFKFAPNYTIWNKNFLVFYNKIKLIKPEAVKSKWSLWRM